MEKQSNYNKQISVRQIKIEDYDYYLPDEKIAKYPLKERDASKLLIYKDGEISESVFSKLADFLPSGSLLVFNNTKVIRARLNFQKETGAKIEIFCLEPHNPIDYQLAFQQTKNVEWKCIVGNSKKWKKGALQKEVEINNEKVKISATRLETENKDHIVLFEWDKGFTFSEIIEHAGIIPIPPYLNRESEQSDNTTYQTIFAKIKGSVAAPTAALHFTEAVTKSLRDKNISTSEITLHVGAGTFQPVKSETIDEHAMHSEVVSVSKQLIENLIEHKGQIIATGTTSVRSLESIYWLGCKLTNLTTSQDLFQISQWEAYGSNNSLPKQDALELVLQYMQNNGLENLHFSTQIIIAPGYEFKIIDGMLTNFHQPKSTLLLLISAFLGEQWKNIYDYALKNNFRFLSYGDSNLYLK